MPHALDAPALPILLAKQFTPGNTALISNAQPRLRCMQSADDPESSAIVPIRRTEHFEPGDLSPLAQSATCAPRRPHQQTASIGFISDRSVRIHEE
jgi:hypothetical protein